MVTEDQFTNSIGWYPKSMKVESLNRLELVSEVVPPKKSEVGTVEKGIQSRSESEICHLSSSIDPIENGSGCFRNSGIEKIVLTPVS
jgi:hypothetical protein